MVARVSIKAVIWSHLAELKLADATLYCRKMFGGRIAAKFYRQAKERASLLARFPYIGPLDPDLSDVGQMTYRHLLTHSHFKLIYYVDEVKLEVHVVDFWDTRRDPTSLVEDFMNNE